MSLPRCILFPQAMLPLHIFEERYRQMLTDSLLGHRIFCIGTVRQEEGKREGKESIYDTLGVGLIRIAVGKPDGTSNLIVQGLCRARVLDILDSKPYRRVRIEPLTSFGGDHISVDALAAKVSELVTYRAKLGSKIPENALKFLTTLHDPGTLSDLVSFSLLEDYRDKQMILETLDLRVRLQKVITMLQKDIRRLKVLQKIQNVLGDEKAKLN